LMSQQVTTAPTRSLRATLVIYVLAPLVLLGIVVGVLVFRNRDINPKTKPGGEVGEENQLALARAALGKQSDLATCRGAIQQLNAHVNAHREQVQKELKSPDDARQVLQGELKLPDDDFNEVASPTFTTLDAHHLEMCFLLRDVARSLDLAGPAARRKDGEKAPTQLAPLKRAELAFDWVMRQVQLVP